MHRHHNVVLFLDGTFNQRWHGSISFIIEQVALDNLIIAVPV